MADVSFTIIDDGRLTTIQAAVDDGSVRVPPEQLREALGYELTPEGLCHGDICFRVTDRAALVNDAGVDLGHLAEIVDRPLAIDEPERVAYLGISAGDRSAALASGAAPDFTLPDLHGTPHGLSDYRGTKVLLIAHASW
jgi:hypothetical protein